MSTIADAHSKSTRFKRHCMYPYIIATVLSCMQTSVHADYVLEIHLLQFRNPSGKNSFDVCCDFNCRNGCDNRFVFCLRPSGTLSNNDNNCPLGRYQTGVIADNNAEFNLGELDSERDISNPLNFTGPLWPVSF